MKFYLPDFYNKYKLNMKIVELLQEHPEYFYDNVQIGGIYGTFPGAIWNGGREMLGITTSSNIKQIIQDFNNINIPLCFTFSNTLIQNYHLYDTYCNIIMNIADNNFNEVIINSPLLESYLREMYPNFKYTFSTTKCERDIFKINNACKKYDKVVLDYRDNNNFDFLNLIEDKSKIELLINSYCDPNCQLREKHYEILSLGQLTFDIIQHDIINNCPTQNRNFLDTLTFDSVIKNKDLYNIYYNTGFNHFKIEGRLVNNTNVIESYLYYLIKPDYILLVRSILSNFI